MAGGRRPDPSAVICRQLGVALHELDGATLPIYLDGNKISDELDKEADE